MQVVKTCGLLPILLISALAQSNPPLAGQFAKIGGISTNGSTNGYQAAVVDQYGKACWDTSRNAYVIWGEYRFATFSEGNNYMGAFDYASNRWNWMTLSSAQHTSHRPQIGHQWGYQTCIPDNKSVIWWSNDQGNTTEEYWTLNQWDMAGLNSYDIPLFTLGSNLMRPMVGGGSVASGFSSWDANNKVLVFFPDNTLSTGHATLCALSGISSALAPMQCVVSSTTGGPQAVQASGSLQYDSDDHNSYFLPDIGLAATFTNGSPVIGTSPSPNYMTAGTVVSFSGTLPSPLVAGTAYYVSSNGLTNAQIEVSATLGGPVINMGASGTATVAPIVIPYALTSSTVGCGGPALCASWTKTFNQATCTDPDCVVVSGGVGAPAGRSFAGWAYTTVDHKWMMMGGTTQYAIGTPTVVDVWTFDPAANSGNGAWAEVCGPNKTVCGVPGNPTTATFPEFCTSTGVGCGGSGVGDRLVFDPTDNVFMFEDTFGQMWVYALTNATGAYARNCQASNSCYGVPTPTAPIVGPLNRNATAGVGHPPVAPSNANTQTGAIDLSIDSPGGGAFYLSHVEPGEPGTSGSCLFPVAYIWSNASGGTWLPGGTQAAACSAIGNGSNNQPSGHPFHLKLGGTDFEIHDKYNWAGLSMNNKTIIQSYNSGTGLWSGGDVGCFSALCFSNNSVHPQDSPRGFINANGTPAVLMVEKLTSLPEQDVFVGTCTATLGAGPNCTSLTGSSPLNVFSSMNSVGGSSPGSQVTGAAFNADPLGNMMACWSEEVNTPATRYFLNQPANLFCAYWNGTAFSYIGAKTATTTASSAILSVTNSFVAGEAVAFKGTAPAPAVVSTPYYVISTGLSGTQCELSATPGGAAVVFTATTTGTLVASLNQSSSSWARDPSVVYGGGVWYVAYTEQTQSGLPKGYVMSLPLSGSPIVLGGGPLNLTSNDYIAHPSLTADGTAVYVGFDYQSAYGQHVQGKIEGWSGTTWNTIASGIVNDSTNGSVADTSIVVTAPGHIQAAWEELSWGNAPQIFTEPFTTTPSFSTSLTVQEALFPGAATTGIARANEPVTVGVPIADSVGLTILSSLGLTGATAAQFTTEENWPDGNIKWVKIRASVSSVPAGGTASMTFSNSGTGNFGGQNLATDNGTTITVSTNGGSCGAGSAICFTVRKSNFDLIDQMQIGATILVSSGSSAGLTVTAPASTALTSPFSTPTNGPYTVTANVNDAFTVTTESGTSSVTFAPGSGITAATLVAAIGTVAGVTITTNGSGGITFTPTTAGRTGFIALSGKAVTGLFGFPYSPLGVAGTATCSPSIGGTACNTVYSTANDGTNSTCTVEENGPAAAVLDCQADLNDGAGHVYMHTTTRLYFYQGSSNVRAQVALRNADFGTGTVFATAYKGIQAFEARIVPNLSGALTYTLGATTCPSGTCTGTITAGSGDYAYIYGSEFDWLQWGGDYINANCPATPTYGRCVKWSPLRGYAVMNSIGGTPSTQATGAFTQYPAGWADISNASGAGVEIGQYEMAGYGNESLEFRSGGQDVRVGMWAGENNTTSTSTLTPNVPYYISYPDYSIHDIYLSFHASALISPANTFLKQQHYLLARAPISWYNSSNVFYYPLVDPTEETNFYTQAMNAFTPTLATSPVSPANYQDLGAASTNYWALLAYKFYNWQAGGSPNQSELRLSEVFNFLRRGHTGEYLNAAHFYKLISEMGLPRSDGFSWAAQPGSNTIYYNFPVVTDSNSNSNALLGMKDWVGDDMEHAHIYGIMDYYLVSGDESVKDFIQDAYPDTFTNTVSTGNMITAMTNSLPAYMSQRSLGNVLLGISRLANFENATGNSATATALLSRGNTAWVAGLKNPLCTSSSGANNPTGCTLNLSATWSPYNAFNLGTNPDRGVTFQRGPTAGGTCSFGTASPREQKSIFLGPLTQGMWEFRQEEGTGWSDYNTISDYMLGLMQMMHGTSGMGGSNFGEMYVDDGTNIWNTGNGMRYGIWPDGANAPAGVTCQPDYPVLQPGCGNEGCFDAFWPAYYSEGQYLGASQTNLKRQTQMMVESVMGNCSPISCNEIWQYTIGRLIYLINHPSANGLQTAPLTSFTDNGGGSYTLGWTNPPGTASLRAKYGTRQIVDYIGYNDGNASWVGNPNTTQNWWSSTDVPGMPAPLSGPQTAHVTGLPTGLTSANFMIKVMAPLVSGTNVYLRSGGPQPQIITGATNATPIVITTQFPHNYSSSCNNTTNVCVCAIEGVSTGTGPSPANGVRECSYVDTTHLALYDTSGTPVAGTGNWFNGISPYFNANSPAGVQWEAPLTSYNIPSSSGPLGFLGRSNGDLMRSLATSTANGLSSIIVTGGSGGSCASTSCTVTVNLSYDPTAMKFPVAAGQSFSITGTGSSLDTCGSGGGAQSPYTVASVTSSSYTSTAFTCTGLTTGTYTGLHMSCGPAAVPNDTIGGVQDCAVASFYATTNNSWWTNLTSTMTSQGLNSSPGYKTYFDGGNNVPGQDLQTDYSMAAIRFLVDRSNPLWLAETLYSLNNDFRSFGVGYMRNSSSTATEPNFQYLFDLDMDALSVSYSVAAHAPEGSYWTASEQQTFLNRMYNDLDDPSQTTCSTASQDAANINNHTYELSSGLLAAGTNDATHAQLPATDPNFSNAGYYVGTEIAIRNGVPDNVSGWTFGLVTAHSAAGVLTVSSWKNGVGGAGVTPDLKELATATYNSGLTVTGTTGQLVRLAFAGSGSGIVALTGTNTIAAGTPITIISPGTTAASAPTTATVTSTSTTATTATGTASVTTTLGNPYIIFDTAILSTTTGGAAATLTFTKTSNPTVNTGDGLMLNNGWGADFFAGGNVSMVTGAPTGTAVPVINNASVSGSTTVPQMVWRFMPWQPGDCGRLSATKGVTDRSYGAQAVVYGASVNHPYVTGSPDNKEYIGDAAANGGGADQTSWQAMDLVAAPDDSRAVRDLARMNSYFFDWGIRPLIDASTGRLRDGPAYSYDLDLYSLEYFQWSLTQTVPIYPSLYGTWAENVSYFNMFDTLPQRGSGGGGYKAGWAGQSGFGGSNAAIGASAIVNYGITTMPSMWFNPTSNASKMNRNWLENVTTTNLWGKILPNFTALAFLHNDPRIGSSSYTALPLQSVFNVSSSANVTSLTGWPSLYRDDMAISRTCWICSSGTYTSFDSSTGTVNGTTYDGYRAGPITIWKGGAVLLGGDSNPSSTCWTCDGSKTLDSLSFNSGGQLQFQTNVGTATYKTPITSWAGQSTAGSFGSMFGDNASRFAGACGNEAPAYNQTRLGISIDHYVRCWVHLKVPGHDEFIFQDDDAALTTGTATMDWRLQYIENGTAQSSSFGGYTTGTTNLSAGVITSTEDGLAGRNYGLQTEVFSPGTVTLRDDCVGLAGGQCSPSSPPTGGNGFTHRFSVCGGAACGTPVSSMVSVAAHKVMQSLSDTTYTASALNPDVNWTGSQVTGAVSTGVALFARGGITQQAMSPVSVPFSGPGDWIIMGVTPGVYSVTVGGNMVAGDPFTVSSGDNSIMFSTTGGGTLVMVNDTVFTQDTMPGALDIVSILKAHIYNFLLQDLYVPGADNASVVVTPFISHIAYPPNRTFVIK